MNTAVANLMSMPMNGMLRHALATQVMQINAIRKLFSLVGNPQGYSAYQEMMREWTGSIHDVFAAYITGQGPVAESVRNIRALGKLHVPEHPMPVEGTFYTTVAALPGVDRLTDKEIEAYIDSQLPTLFEMTDEDTLDFTNDFTSRVHYMLGANADRLWNSTALDQIFDRLLEAGLAQNMDEPQQGQHDRSMLLRGMGPEGKLVYGLRLLVEDRGNRSVMTYGEGSRDPELTTYVPLEKVWAIHGTQRLIGSTAAINAALDKFFAAAGIEQALPQYNDPSKIQTQFVRDVAEVTVSVVDGEGAEQSEETIMFTADQTVYVKTDDADDLLELRASGLSEGDVLHDESAVLRVRNVNLLQGEVPASPRKLIVATISLGGTSTAKAFVERDGLVVVHNGATGEAIQATALKVGHRLFTMDGDFHDVLDISEQEPRGYVWLHVENDQELGNVIAVPEAQPLRVIEGDRIVEKSLNEVALGSMLELTDEHGTFTYKLLDIHLTDPLVVVESEDTASIEVTLKRDGVERAEVYALDATVNAFNGESVGEVSIRNLTTNHRFVEADGSFTDIVSLRRVHADVDHVAHEGDVVTTDAAEAEAGEDAFDASEGNDTQDQQ